VFLDLAFELHELFVVVFGFGKVPVEFVFKLFVVFLFGLEVGFVGLDVLLDLFECFVASGRVLRETARECNEELEHVLDQFVVDRVELFVDGVELVVAVFPEVHFVAQAAALVVFLVLLLPFVDDGAHGAEPAVHGRFDGLQHVRCVFVLVCFHESGYVFKVFFARVFEEETGVLAHHVGDDVAVALDFGLKFWVDLEFDLSLGVFDGLDDVVVEASELVHEFLVLALLATAPLTFVHFAQERQEAVESQVLEGVGQVVVEFAIGHVFVEVGVPDLFWGLGAHEVECEVWDRVGVQVYHH
jgi:hypothetical protein